MDKKDPKLVLNITYHPSFFKLKNVLKEIHLLLTPDEKHRSAFPDVPVIGFKRGRSLKDLLVKAKLPTPTVSGKSNGCQAKCCGIGPVFVDTKSKFTDSESTREYEIMTNLNCNSKNVVYLVQFKVCNIQYLSLIHI